MQNKEQISRVVQNVYLSQVSFLFGLLVCVLIIPDGLWANKGISFYGTRWQTILPYLFAFVSSGYFIWRAAVQIPKRKKLHYIRVVLFALLPMQATIVLTPYTVSEAVHLVHQICAATVFSLQLLLSLWLILIVDRKATNRLLLYVELLGATLGLLSYFEQTTYLLQGQLIFQLAFSMLMVRILAATHVWESD